MTRGHIISNSSPHEEILRNHFETVNCIGSQLDNFLTFYKLKKEMKRRVSTEDDTLEEPAKKRSRVELLYELNDENIWIHDVFSFLSLQDYHPVLLTNSIWNSRLKRNNSFLFFQMCLNYQRGMPFPSLQFFKSSLAERIREEVREEAMRTRKSFQVSEFECIEQEEIVRERMKTVFFQVNLLPQNHPSQSLLEEWDDLTELYELLCEKSVTRVPPRRRMLKQIERVAPYLRNAIGTYVSLNTMVARYLRQHKETWIMRRKLIPVILQDSYVENIPKGFLEDREFVLQLLRIDGSVFQQVSHLYGNDREMVLTGVRSNHIALQLASNELRSNRPFAFTAVHLNPCAIIAVSKELSDDPHLCMTALKGAIDQNITYIYQALSPRLQHDLDHARIAMSINPSEIYTILPPELQQNRELALMCPFLNAIPTGLNNDREICLKVVNSYPYQITAVSPELTTDMSFVVSVIIKNPHLFSHFPFIANDREILKQILHKRGSILFHLNEVLQQDLELVKCALHSPDRIFNNQLAFHLRDDKELAKEAISLHGYCYSYCSRTVMEDRELALLAVQKCGGMIRFVPEHFRNDPQFVTYAVNDKGFYLKYTSEEMKNNREIVLLAVKNFPTALVYASETLQQDEELIALAQTQYPAIGTYLANHRRRHQPPPPPSDGY